MKTKWILGLGLLISVNALGGTVTECRIPAGGLDWMGLGYVDTLRIDETSSGSAKIQFFGSEGSLQVKVKRKTVGSYFIYVVTPGIFKNAFDFGELAPVGETKFEKVLNWIQPCDIHWYHPMVIRVSQDESLHSTFHWQQWAREIAFRVQRLIPPRWEKVNDQQGFLDCRVAE